MLTDLGEYWSNGQLYKIRRYTYTYDANNNMLTDLYEDWENGQWVNGLRYTYTYDANNNMLTYLREYGGYGEWVYTSRSTYTYDANNNRLSYLHERWENGQWVDGWRETYTYDANNNMLTDLYEYGVNGQWVNDYRNTYTYDVQDNMISLWHHVWLNSSWIPRDSWTDGFPRPRPFQISDSGGNEYNFYSFYNITFIYKLIVTEVESQNGELPESYSLSQNYPNPFNPSTTYRYSIPTQSKVVIKVFDILGNEIETLVNEEKPIGNYEVKFDATALPSGVYFCQLKAGDFIQVKKMLLLK